jgi:hypothetical protein
MTAAFTTWEPGVHGANRSIARLVTLGSAVVLIMASAYALARTTLLANAPARASGDGAGAPPFNEQTAFLTFIWAQALVLPLQERVRRRWKRWHGPACALSLMAGTGLAATRLLPGRPELIGFLVAGFSAALLQVRTVARALEPLSTARGRCLWTILGCCCGMLAIELGLSFVAVDASVPLRVLSWGGVQAALIVFGSLRLLYPPPPGTFPVGS